MWDKRLRIACVSDIHLGHRKNRTVDIIRNLNKYLSCDSLLSQTDLLILAGDVFDDLLPLNSEDVPHIKAWIARLLRLCKKYDVVVRVLEGTPSHDREQSMLFPIINEIHEHNSGGQADLVWVQGLEIEHIAKFGIDVLYIQDEYRHDTAETLAEAKALMASKGLEQVDFAVMHGMFTYQVPPAAKNLPLHNEAEYLALVRHLIFIGHVHTHTRFERIVAQGSFDRIAHGEEGPKGFVTAVIETDGTHEVTFVENQTACKFTTIDCSYEDVEQNLMHIDRIAADLPHASHVRIRANYGNPILTSLDVVRSRWPLLIWSNKSEDKEDVGNVILIKEFPTAYVAINIDRHNLKDLLMPRLGKLGLDAEVLRRCAANIGEMQQL